MQISYCASLVRTHDPDRYLCTLFAPADVREDWFALFAFNHEIAAIAEIVSEELIGHIRFAWWREALDEIYSSSAVRNHLVAQALAQTIRKHSLPRALFDALLTARMEDLQQTESLMLAQFEPYARDTSGALLELCALAAGTPRVPAFEHLGIAWALVGTLRCHENVPASREFLDAAKQHLRDAKDALPQVFLTFLQTAEFYFGRIQAGRRTTHPLLRTRLAAGLWVKHLLRSA